MSQQQGARQSKITVCIHCEEKGRKQLMFDHDTHGVYYICDACYSDELLKFAEDRGYYPGITRLGEEDSQALQIDEAEYSPSEDGEDSEYEDSEEVPEDSEQ